MLGARPYADRRLQPDVVLAELARKLFPAADARRDAAFRLARARPRSGARREGAAARGRRRAATHALRERALPPGRRGRAEACGGEKAQAPACRACPVSAERRMRALLPAESRGAHAQARRADVEGGAPGHIARVRLPPRAPAQQMPLGQAVPLFVCPAEAPGGGAAPAGEAAELERPYLRVPPGMQAAALARYVAAQLGLLPGEAVGLSCGGRALAGDATLGDTLDEARGAGGAAGLVEYGVGGSGAESRMLVVCFRVLPPAEDAAPGPAAGGPAAAGAEPGGIDPDRGGGAGAAPLLPGAAEAAAWS